MRRRLYGSLAALAAVAALGILVTEYVDGSCAVLCDWQVALAVVAFGALAAFAVLTIVAAAYELQRIVRRRRVRV